MPPTKMTVKELSIEVEKLKQSDVEKDNLIKSLDEKISFLQNWAQDFCNKTNEMNQHSTNNVKILKDKINEVEGKDYFKAKSKSNREANKL